MTFVSGSTGVSFNADTRTLRYTTGTLLGSGGSEEFTVTVGVAADFVHTNLTNSATDAPPARTTAPSPGNNTGTDTDAVTRRADLSIAKSDGVPSVVAGTSTT